MVPPLELVLSIPRYRLSSAVKFVSDFVNRFKHILVFMVHNGSPLGLHRYMCISAFVDAACCDVNSKFLFVFSVVLFLW